MIMPRAKVYPGKRVRNKRWSNRVQHFLRPYYRNRSWVGIYSDTFDIFVKILAKRTKNRQQNVVMVEGDTGSGKSTLAIQMAYALAKALGKDFDLNKDYIYSIDDLWKKLEDPNASPISLIDEAVLVLNSKRSQSNDSVDIVNLFNTMRSRGWSTILCAPSIKLINKDVRCLHVDYDLYCSSEDNSFLPGYGRGFFELSKMKRKRFSKKSADEPYQMLLSTGVFKALPKRIDDEYQPIKSRAQDTLLANAIERRKRVMGVKGDA